MFPVQNDKEIRRKRIALTNPLGEFEKLSQEAVLHDTARCFRIKTSNPGNNPGIKGWSKVNGWSVAEFLLGIFNIIPVDRVKRFLKVYCTHRKLMFFDVKETYCQSYSLRQKLFYL